MKAAAIFEVDENVDLSRCIFGGDWNLYFIHKGERRASVVGHLIRGLRPLPEAPYWLQCTDFEDGWIACLEKIMGGSE